MSKPKQVRPGVFWCEKHQGEFVSTKYIRTGKIPAECNVCKQRHWWNQKHKRYRK